MIIDFLRRMPGPSPSSSAARNWREWNLEQLRESTSYVRRVSSVAERRRLIGSYPTASRSRTSIPAGLILSGHSRVVAQSMTITRSDIEDFENFTRYWTISRHFLCAAKWGETGGSRGKGTGTTQSWRRLRRDGSGRRREEGGRGSAMCLRRGGRVMLLHDRGVPISGVGSSAAFNCVSISSREPGDFSIGVSQPVKAFGRVRRSARQ